MCQRRTSSGSRRGQALVEFALVALVMYLLLAAVITFGYLLYAAGGLQQAADVAAREIARTPLPVVTESTGAPLTLEMVLYGNAQEIPELADVRSRVFDQHYLVIDLDNLQGRSLNEHIAELPVVNQQLVPLMISDRVGDRRVLRYPGAVFTDTDNSDDPVDPPPSGLLVAIPRVVARPARDAVQIDWVPVIEEIDSANVPDPFLVTSAHRGIVALRLNYPYQSSAMSGFEPNEQGRFEPTMGRPIIAEEGGVQVVDEDGYGPSGSTLESDEPYGPYAGPHGLGRQAAWGRDVRPYSRLISTQAIHRREVIR